MAEPTSTAPTLPSSAKADEWRNRWQHQDAWTVREFAQLCCGWNPSVYEFPNRDLYNEALESINRAVRAKVLPTIELLWSATGAERLYDSVPMFRPQEVASWAAKRYPDTFPYPADAWVKEGERHSATWGDVKIEFTSDERVQITVGAKTYTRNYADMGFEDGRKKTPNAAWEVLKKLAEHRGTISASSPRDWPKIEKRVQDIRRILRAHFLREFFEISTGSDPLPFVKGTGYRASFAIATRPSYHT